LTFKVIVLRFYSFVACFLVLDKHHLPFLKLNVKALTCVDAAPLFSFDFLFSTFCNILFMPVAPAGGTQPAHSFANRRV
jgi:hypothetical protein